MKSINRFNLFLNKEANNMIRDIQFNLSHQYPLVDFVFWHINYNFLPTITNDFKKTKLWYAMNVAEILLQKGYSVGQSKFIFKTCICCSKCLDQYYWIDCLIKKYGSKSFVSGPLKLSLVQLQ